MRESEDLRFNLKNFPDVPNPDWCEYCAKTYRWKKGFEAELRERLEKLEDMVYAIEVGELEGWASDLVAEAKKEILGE